MGNLKKETVITKIETVLGEDNLGEWKGDLKNLLIEFSDVFDVEDTSPANVEPIHVGIKEGYEERRFFRPEPLRSAKEQAIIDNNARKLIAQGKAKVNPYSMHQLGQVIVSRKDKEGKIIEGRERVCLDCRPVNKALKHYKHPVPQIQTILRRMCRYFSELDLSESFEQFRISNELSELLTFSTSFGKVSMLVLPYGVQFASDKLQETLSREFFEFLELWLMIYIDNLLIYTDTWEEHLQSLKVLLGRCRQMNIKLRIEKCAFLKKKIRTMGYVVEHLSIHPDPSKVDMLIKAKEPESVVELQSFLGLLQFYKGMLPHLAHAAHSLYAATTENLPFQWTAKLNRAFLTVKTMLVKEIMQSELVGEENIKVMVDASKYAVCVVLCQSDRIIFCASKVLNGAQRNWSTIERELFAAAWGVKKLRSYIYGIGFDLMTDHKPLVGLLGKLGEAPNTRMQIMMLSLAEYQFEVKYLPGIRNILADYGTRHIDTKEWDKPKEDDPEGLHELLVMEQSEFRNMFSTGIMDNRDEEQIKKLSLDTWQENGVTMLKLKGKTYIWTPIQSKRALFWEVHGIQHVGISRMLKDLKRYKIFWHQAAKEIGVYLSQCLCTVKKDYSPRPYTERVSISARYPLHILAIDLYTYKDVDYLTAVCIFSAYYWAKKIGDKEAETVKEAYNDFCNQHAEPQLLSCDNGPEFNLIETEKIDNPSYHPQSNGLLERLHREIGKQCRIHGKNPNEVMHIINTTESNDIMQNYLEEKKRGLTMTIVQCTTRQFFYNN